MIDVAVAPTRQRQAQRELARRELARRSLLEYSCYVDPKVARLYRAPHLQLAAQAFDAVVEGRTKRLMLFMPNRHWKSSLITRKGVSYFIGRRVREGRPHQVMIISHTATLAEEFSGYSRNLVRDVDGKGQSLYRNVFPEVRISRTRQAEKEWGLLDPETGAEEPFPTVTAGSMGAPPTGSGADLLIIDDPVKTPAEARSPSTQDAHWNTYQQGLHTRLNDENESAIILMMTRWHIEDLAGKLLRNAQENPTAEQWKVLCLPALAYTPEEVQAARRVGIPVPEDDPLGRTPGAALWPERFSRTFHLKKKAASARSFASIGQQLPIQEGGQLLGRDAFQVISSPPERVLRWVIASDWALKSKEVAKDEPDFAVFGLLGLWLPDKTDRTSVRLVIGGLVRTQMGINAAKILCRKFAISMSELIGRRPPIVAAADNIDTIALGDLRAHPELLGFPIHDLSDRSMKRKLGTFKGDKVEKSAAWRSRAEAGSVYVIGEGWGQAALERMFASDAERRQLLGDETLAWHSKMFQEIEGFPDWFNDDIVDMISVGNHALGGDVSGHKKKARSRQG